MIQDGNGASLRHASGPVYAPNWVTLCVSVFGDRHRAERLNARGVVDSKADQLRVTYDDGREVDRTGSTGRSCPAFPSYRVFMLDLGRNLYQRLELSDERERTCGGNAVGRREIQMMRCGDRLPPALPGQQAPNELSLHDCIKRAAPK